MKNSIQKLIVVIITIFIVTAVNAGGTGLGYKKCTYVHSEEFEGSTMEHPELYHTVKVLVFQDCPEPPPPAEHVDVPFVAYSLISKESDLAVYSSHTVDNEECIVNVTSMVIDFR